MKYHFSQIELNGEYKYISEINLTGYTKAELLGKTAYNMFNPLDLVQITLAHADLLSYNRCSAIYRLRRKNGKFMWVRTCSERTGEHISSCTMKLNWIEIVLYKLRLIKK